MERISLPVKTRFEKIDQINDEFTRCKCYIMAIGKNGNGSHFSRKSVEDALPTFKNIPVIAFLYDGDDGEKHAAGHEMKLVERDGKDVWQTKCRPYGLVPDCEFAFEEVTEEDGTKATYLTGEVILWSSKYPEIMDAIYSDEVYFSQSMEIKALDVKKFEEDPRYVDIVKFSASALCLLGKSDDADYDVKPCFPSASVIPFSLDEEFTKLMDEMRFALAECFSNNKEEGEKEMLIDETKIDFEEQSVETAEEVVVEVDAEQTEEQFEEQIAEEIIEEPAEELVNEKFEQFEQFASTYREKYEAISCAIQSMRICDNVNDHYKYYYLVDFDDQYAYVHYSEYTDDNYAEGVGRVTYAFEDKEAKVTSEFEKMFVKWLTEEELEALNKTESDFVAYKAAYSTSNDEVEELRKFKEDRLAEDHRIEVEAILEQFEDLNGNEEFETLKKNAIEFENVEDLETKCYAIRGRTVQVNFSANKSKNVNIPIGNKISHKSADDELYGGLFSMYNFKKD